MVENLEKFREKIGLPKKIIFKKDNDPKHRFKYVKYFFKNGYNLLEWPKKSTDLIPIEHLWDHLKREVKKYSSTNIAELKEVVLKIYSETSPELCRK